MRIFIIFMVLLVGCGDNILSPNDSRLIGTWDTQTTSYYWGSISNPDSTFTDQSLFDSDPGLQIGSSGNSFSFRWIFEASSDTLIEILGAMSMFRNRTWRTDGNKLIITNGFDNIEIIILFTYAIDDNQLSLTSKLDHTERFGDWKVIELLKNDDPS